MSLIRRSEILGWRGYCEIDKLTRAGIFDAVNVTRGGADNITNLQRSSAIVGK